MTEVRLHWSVKSFENFIDTFTLEDLPASIRNEIEGLIEDGVVPYADVLDLDLEDDVDNLVADRETPEKSGSYAVESRYISGVEFLPPTPPTRAAVGYTGITENPDDLV